MWSQDAPCESLRGDQIRPASPKQFRVVISCGIYEILRRRPRSDSLLTRVCGPPKLRTLIFVEWDASQLWFPTRPPYPRSRGGPTEGRGLWGVGWKDYYHRPGDPRKGVGGFSKRDGGGRNYLGALAPKWTPTESSLKKRVVARSAHSGDCMSCPRGAPVLGRMGFNGHPLFVWASAHYQVRGNGGIPGTSGYCIFLSAIFRRFDVTMK